MITSSSRIVWDRSKTQWLMVGFASFMSVIYFHNQIFDLVNTKVPNSFGAKIVTLALMYAVGVLIIPSLFYMVIR